MAKKEESVETTQKVNTAKIELTEAEALEFAQYKIAQEQKKIDEEQAAALKGKSVNIMLTFEHNINGKKYGPGKTLVAASLVGHLQNVESKKRDAEMALYMDRKRVVQLSMGGQVIKSYEGDISEAIR